ncbi:MAG TPA: class I SAM-dependent methyltransferase, partial [Phycisphaerales bacterium]|nr:class I SAM-dependent methyltransferase [Phycisphaerales bacterium]
MAAPGDKPPTRSTLTADYQRDWPEYFEAVDGKGGTPRDTVVRALDLFEKDPPTRRTLMALDVACGQGRDALEMLRRTDPRWRVIAIDSHTDATRRTLAAIDIHDMERVIVCQLAMEELPQRGAGVIPPHVDLVNAAF